MNNMQKYKDYSIDEIINESKESNWYYEIREILAHFGEYMVIDPWDETGYFESFDWDLLTDENELDDEGQNLKLFAIFMDFLKNDENVPDGDFKLYKIISEEIPKEKIDMILTSDKYNL